MKERVPDDLMARLMATFEAEAEEHLKAMNGFLARLRDNTDTTAIQKLVEPLAREAHSLKGAARAVGAEPVEAVAARLEELFDRLRSGELDADSAVRDAASQLLDTARTLTRDATAGKTAAADPATALRELHDAIDELAAANAAVERRIRDLRALAGRLQDATPPAGEPQGEAARSRRVVLLVEDSVLTRSVQKRLLEDAGYEVRTAGDGVEAWNLLRQGGIDVVVSDILMAGMDGYDLATAIRGDGDLAALPVILITATDTPDRRARSRQAGADAYVVKGSPEHQDLAATIERLS